MSTQVAQQVILLPRFTAIAGEGSFLTAPLNVRAYAYAMFHFTVVSGLGATPPTVEVFVEHSPDLEHWEAIGDALDIGEPSLRDFSFEWVRLRIEVSGDDPAFTCWCVGEFVVREE